MINYLIESSVCLLVMLLLYRLLLAKTSMHQIKRTFLLACLIIPLLLPLASVDVYYEPAIVKKVENTSTRWTGLNLLEEEAHQALVTTSQVALTDPEVKKTSKSIDWVAIVATLYLVVTLLFLIRLAINIGQIRRLADRSEQKYLEQYRLVLLDKMASPYSFFRYIFIGKSDFEEPDLKQHLLTHELVHVKQWHSIDILLLELCKAIYWFNPMYWLLSKSIRLNHEFIADAGVIAKSDNRQSYQHMLLQFYQRPKVSSPLVSPSDYSFIKNRFQMMQKTTQKKTAVLRLMLLIPVMGGIIFSFAMDLKPKPEVSDSSQAIVQKPSVTDQPIGFPIDSVFYSVDLSDLAPIPDLYMTNTYPGIDITSRKGRSVIASANGIVKEVSQDDKNYGKYVLIEHNERFSTLYASLSEISVGPGDQVKLGQRLGAVGKSMVVHAVSPHIYRVHYAVRQNGEWTSPYDFIKLPPQPQTQKAGFTATPFGYGRSLDVIPDERSQPNILPFKAEDGSYIAFTGMISSTKINSIQDTKLGTEFFSLPNTKVQATADGVVKKVVANHKTYGNYVMIQHGETHETMYAKLDEISVTKGQSVQRGNTIGTIGRENEMFGRLHYKVKRGSLTMSPTNYFLFKGSQGPKFTFFDSKWNGFAWDFPSGFAFKTIKYNKEEVVFTKTSGEVITREAKDLSHEEKASLLSLNRQPYPFAAKRPVPEVVYSRWEKPWAYKIFIDGKHIESKEMVNYKPEDFAHSSWVVVSKAVKKRNGYAFELRLQTQAYYDQLKKNHQERVKEWKSHTLQALPHFKDF